MKRPPFVSAHEQTAASRAVGHVSQTGALNACGPACMLMLLRDRGLAMDVSARAAAISIDRLDKYTSADDLARLAALHGVATLRGANIRGAYIALVWYQVMPDANKLPQYRGENGKFFHWIVVIEPGKYFDPLHYTDNGQPFTATISDDAQHRISLVPVEVPAKMTQIKIIGDWWRVRTDTTVYGGKPAAPAIGVLTRGMVCEAEIISAAGATWAAVKLSAGGHPLTTEAGAPVFGYLMAGPGWRVENTVTLPVVVTPPPAPIGFPPATTTQRPARTRLGVSVLGAHHLVEPAIAAGCKSILIMDGALFCRQMAEKYPDIMFLYRVFIPHGNPTLDPLTSDPIKQALELNLPNVTVMGFMNEGDSIGQSAGQITQRAAFDRKCFEYARARGTRYAGGSFSMGTPDYTSPEICAEMKAVYATLYNAGMGFNYHSYSPTVAHAADVWFEQRAAFPFARCGFTLDPNHPIGIVSDETGADNGGGFPAQGASNADIRAWSQRFVDALSVSASVDGVGSPAPLIRYATVFQAGQPGWGRFDVAGALPDIGAARSAQTPWGIDDLAVFMAGQE